MKPLGMIIMAIMLLSTIAGCLDKSKHNVPVMNVEELMDDYANNVDNTSRTVTSWLMSLKEGDTVIIRDELHALSYHEQVGKAWTEVTFASFTNFSFPIEGNISGPFKKGDVAELRLHITNVTFTRRSQHTNETWTFHLETFKEGWDDEHHQRVPIQQTCLHRIE